MVVFTFGVAFRVTSMVNNVGHSDHFLTLSLEVGYSSEPEEDLEKGSSMETDPGRGEVQDNNFFLY